MDRGTLHQMRRHRVLVLGGFDALVWFGSVLGYTVLRYEAATLPEDLIPWRGAFGVATASVVLFLVLGFVVRLHHGRAALGSLEEMILLGAVTGTTGLVLAVGNAYFIWVPRTVPVASTFVALVLMAWGRAAYRQLRERDAARSGAGTPAHTASTPVLVLGAGESGRQLVASMLRDPAASWRPVGLVDDDPLKRHRRVSGVPVLGTSLQLEEIGRRVGAATVVICIPSASAGTIRKLSGRAQAAGLQVKTIPGLAELLRPTGATKRVGIADIRDVNLADLLGRRVIDTDVAEIAGYLTGRRVLVTGAGGSIGSELCRQITAFGPAELILLDRDESALHAVQLTLHGRALLDSDDTVLADIRDVETIRTVFRNRRPDVVFHAAALKHMPMLERHPGEAVRTNVWGTLNVLEAAREAGVERFVNISTDKAANPTNVLGYTKRLAEGLTAAAADGTGSVFLSVRFGNVLGSRGSVLTAFTAQIASGGPVTVTHPEVTRYFMTVQEAIQLVIQAAAIGSPGEVLVLDMGAPVSIEAVARQLIDLSGNPIDIVYTGLRSGEKIHEDLLGRGEVGSRAVHPLVTHATVPPFTADQAGRLEPMTETERLIAQLAAGVDAMSLTPLGRGGAR